MIYYAQFEEIKDNDVILDEDGGETFIEYNGGFVVKFRDVPEALTQGKDFAEAVEMAQDALRTAMEFYDENGKPRPTPSEPLQGDVAINL